MKTSDILNKGPKKVRHVEGDEFMLCVRSGLGGVIGVAPFKIGGKEPRLSKFRLLSAEDREQWLSDLEISL